jgi:hypothetical protein
MIQIIQETNERAQRIAERSHFATEEIAYTMARAYTANPYLDRRILATLAISGMSEQQINQIGNLAVKKMLRDGVVPEGGAPTAPLVIAPRITEQFPSYADEIKKLKNLSLTSEPSSSPPPETESPLVTDPPIEPDLSTPSPTNIEASVMQPAPAIEPTTIEPADTFGMDQL